MPLHTFDYELKSKNRTEIRKEIINTFLSELPGTGKDELTSRYHYTVEKYEDYSIVLKRPTGLNKGFDFTVNVSGFYFKKIKRYSNPSHQDIINALKYVNEHNSEKYSFIKAQVKNIFECKDFSIKGIERVLFPDGDNILRPIPIMLMAIKWLFIEQDITYWNWSGRNMLFNKLINEGLI